MRVAGGAALGILAQIAVDSPGGLFGAAQQVTRPGLLYAAAVTVLAAGAVWGILRRRGKGDRRRDRLARRAAALLPSAVVALTLGAFLPALADDPMIAGGIVFWHLNLAGRLLIAGERPRHADDEDDPWLAEHGPALRHLLAVSLLASTAVLGYRVTEDLGAFLLCLVLDGAALAYALPYLERRWRSGSRAPLLPAALTLAALVAAVRPALGLTLLALAQLAVLALQAAHRPLTREVAAHFFRRPATLVLGSFVALILVGTLFLSFPLAAAEDRAIRPIDALFTATSASCVTGLIVLDTPHDFSLFGQAVILALIQVGGLNIMVLSTFAAVLLGRGIGLRGEQALTEMLDLRSRATAYPLIVFIVSATLLVEAVGATVLALAFRAEGAAPLAAVWKGVFHAVSAFCNAGFALQSDSLVMFRERPLVLLVFALLITVGGLGFGVLASFLPRFRAAHGGRRLPMQVRLVLLTSAGLVVIGTVWYAAAEWQRSLAGLSSSDRWTNALFQSVTLRTAGFNSVDFSLLHPGTVLMMIALMFIGAAPGGTGGGVKTTTAAVLLAALPAIARGEAQVVLLGRTVPLETFYRATAIVLITTLGAFGGLALLLAWEDLAFVEAGFEAVSAIATVGLSLGATAKLGVLGKIVVIVLMLAGRVGPLTLALLLGRREARRVRYPEARVMVG